MHHSKARKQQRVRLGLSVPLIGVCSWASLSTAASLFFSSETCFLYLGTSCQGEDGLVRCVAPGRRGA